MVISHRRPGQMSIDRPSCPSKVPSFNPLPNSIAIQSLISPALTNGKIYCSLYLAPSLHVWVSYLHSTRRYRISRDISVLILFPWSLLTLHSTSIKVHTPHLISKAATVHFLSSGLSLPKTLPMTSPHIQILFTAVGNLPA